MGSAPPQGLKPVFLGLLGIREIGFSEMGFRNWH
jgi:hypothetical protein